MNDGCVYRFRKKERMSSKKREMSVKLRDWEGSELMISLTECSVERTEASFPISS